jgi:hypothetical protein
LVPPRRLCPGEGLRGLRHGPDVDFSFGSEPTGSGSGPFSAGSATLQTWLWAATASFRSIKAARSAQVEAAGFTLSPGPLCGGMTAGERVFDQLAIELQRGREDLRVLLERFRRNRPSIPRATPR